MKFKLVEADGGYGDLGTIPTAPNPAIKKKRIDDECKDADEGKCKFKLKESDLEEAKGDRDMKHKKVAKKTAIARSKAKAKCSSSQSPQKAPGKKIRFVCKTKDKAKARETSKRMKKFNKTSAGKKAKKVRKATKDFRK